MSLARLFPCTKSIDQKKILKAKKKKFCSLAPFFQSEIRGPTFFFGVALYEIPTYQIIRTIVSSKRKNKMKHLSLENLWLLNLSVCI